MKELEGSAKSSPRDGLVPIDKDLFGGIEVDIEARLGTARMTIEHVLNLKPGSTIELDAALADVIDLYLNGALVARGEIVAVGDSFGVRVTEVAKEG